MKLNVNQPKFIFSAEKTFQSSQEELWKLISTPNFLTYCNPFCKNNTAISWQSIGDKDEVVYYSGLVLKREITAWNEGAGYDLKVSSQAEADAVVFWRIYSIDATSCRLSIELNSFPDVALNNYSKLARLLYAERVFKRQMQHYLNAVLEGISYFMSTGNPVEENQFGYNKLFSTKVI